MNSLTAHNETELAKANRELFEARVALGVAMAFITDVEAFRDRLRAVREDEGPMWTCIECGSRYTADVGHCGQLKPFQCEGLVVPENEVIRV